MVDKIFYFKFSKIIWGASALLVLSFPAFSVYAENNQKVDGEKLAQEFQKILEQVITETSAPGGVAAFVLPDGRSYTVAAGMSDKEFGTAMTPKSRMLSASIGKSFVGTVALDLAMEGSLTLDAPISKWLGKKTWFERLPNANTITLRHLLQHRSGLMDHVFLPEYAAASNSGKIDILISPPVDDLVEFILDKEPLFPAGESFSYTDTGYLLVGMVIEKATGHTYYNELKNRVLDPLNLTLTSPSNHRYMHGLVPGYQPEVNLFNMPAKTLDEDGALVFDPAFEWTGGGLVTNAGDIARYAKELYEGRVIKGDYLKELLDGKPTSSDRSESAYGLGQGITQTDFGLVYGHNGWIPGYTSFMVYFADYGISIAAQFNISPDPDVVLTPVNLGKKALPAVIINAIKK